MTHSYGLRCGIRAYYFRKLAKYVMYREYDIVKRIRAKTRPWISIPELLFLRWGIRQLRPQRILEIGSFCGASTSVMADVIQRLGQGYIYAMDLFSQGRYPSEHGGEYWRTFDDTMKPYAGLFKKIEGDSKNIPWNQPIDFLFIDGDHSQEGVSADIAKYTPFVNTGGYVFLHDYLDQPEEMSMVKPVVDRTLMRNPGYRLLGLVTSLIGFQKTSIPQQQRSMA